MAPKRLGVVGNPKHRETQVLLKRLARLGEAGDVDLFIEPSLQDLWSGASPPQWITESDELDGLITLGGDGTLLRGAGQLSTSSPPILGINIGRVGFLTAASSSEFDTAVRAFIDGDYDLDVRSTLTAQVLPHNGRPPISALNDVVMHHAGVARVLQVRIWVNGQEVGQYSADGIIVASPTGSTAYSLSAGGPIVTPDVDVLIVTAISPHTLAVRPLVVRAEATIRIEPVLNSTAQARITADGREATTLLTGDSMEVGRGARSIKMVRLGKGSFFDRVRKKLQWGDLTERL